MKNFNRDIATFLKFLNESKGLEKSDIKFNKETILIHFRGYEINKENIFQLSRFVCYAESYDQKKKMNALYFIFIKKEKRQIFFDSVKNNESIKFYGFRQIHEYNIPIIFYNFNLLFGKNLKTHGFFPAKHVKLSVQNRDFFDKNDFPAQSLDDAYHLYYLKNKNKQDNKYKIDFNER
jgi:hypothetical protein